MAKFVGQVLGALSSVHETGAAMGTLTTVIAAPVNVNARITVVSLTVSADAASTFELLSHDGDATATEISPAHGLAALGQLNLGGGTAPVAVGLPGERLDIIVGGTGPVNYSIWYRVG